MKQFLTVFIGFFILIIMLEPTFAECHTETDLKIQECNNAILSAFDEIIRAENVNANITGLIDQLNTAINLLTQAENAFKNGNNQLAADLAASALTLAKQVKTDAQNAQQTAVIQNQNNLWRNVAFAFVGSFSVILSLFLSWRLVKKHYIDNMLESKPEVT
ncbi:MAG: hypothetical protein ACFCUE_04510 [Candidatus Bathyarchaeia archaeon]|jgi:hypothetical protein